MTGVVRQAWPVAVLGVHGSWGSIRGQDSAVTP